MCGFLVTAQEHPIPEGVVATLSSRGPDENDVKNYLGYNFHHWRLALVGGKSGRQPIQTVEGLVVFNGEIYNWREVAVSFFPEACDLIEGDTQLLLKILSSKRYRALDHIDGIFSFVFIGCDGKFLYGRDHLGIKPLFFTFDSKNKIAFASNAKCLGKLFSKAKQPTLEVMMNALGTVPAPLTQFEDVSRAPCGEVFEYDPTKQTTRSVFKICTTKVIALPESKRAFINDFRDEVYSTVRSQWQPEVSSVPLSGGLDSGVLAYVLKDLPDCNFVSLASRPDDPDQLIATKRARLASRDIVSSIVSRRDVNLEQFFSDFDLPTVDGLNSYLLAKAVNEGATKVLISGIGPDEYLNGYSQPRVRAKRDVRELEVLTSKRLRIIKEVYPLTLQFILMRGTAESLRKLSVDNLEVIERSMETSRSITAIDGENSFYLSNQLIPDADHFTMVNGVELRVPFLSLRLIPYYMAASSYNLADNKQLLREAFASEVVDSLPVKRGFSIQSRDFFSDRQSLSLATCEASLV